ncbi:hypothetical protein AAVH_23268 [Aphelenchoides avenae]|nr:hypothetical protein AAVH_23268 [Aphelenchus avenae]
MPASDDSMDWSYSDSLPSTRSPPESPDSRSRRSSAPSPESPAPERDVSVITVSSDDSEQFVPPRASTPINERQAGDISYSDISSFDDSDYDYNAIHHHGANEVQFVSILTEAFDQAVAQAAAIAAAPPAPAQHDSSYDHDPFLMTVDWHNHPDMKLADWFLGSQLHQPIEHREAIMILRPADCSSILGGRHVWSMIQHRWNVVDQAICVTPNSHISPTGTTYAEYLLQNHNYSMQFPNMPMLRLQDGFFAPLESLLVYDPLGEFDFANVL